MDKSATQLVDCPPDTAQSGLLQSRLALFREKSELPRLFAVVTWGHAATCWVAKVLNSHPEVFCTHNIRSRMGLVLPNVTEVNDADLLSLLRVLAAGYALAGEVHGVTRQNVPTLLESLGDEIRIAGLIREPLARLQSHYAHVQRNRSDGIPLPNLFHVRSLPGFNSIESVVGDNAERLAFVKCTSMLNNILDEMVKLPRIFRCEDVTYRPDCLRDFIEYLSGGAIADCDELAARAMNIAATNRHRVSRDVDFAPWQVAVIRAIVAPAAWRAYEQFDYRVPKFAN